MTRNGLIRLVSALIGAVLLAYLLLNMHRVDSGLPDWLQNWPSSGHVDPGTINDPNNP